MGIADLATAIAIQFSSRLFAALDQSRIKARGQASKGTGLAIAH